MRLHVHDQRRVFRFGSYWFWFVEQKLVPGQNNFQRRPWDHVYHQRQPGTYSQRDKVCHSRLMLSRGSRGVVLGVEQLGPTADRPMAPAAADVNGPETPVMTKAHSKGKARLNRRKWLSKHRQCWWRE